MINNGLFTSNKDDWGTPPDLFEGLQREFRFTIDVAANDHNALLPRFYTPKTDGLAQSWAWETGYMNPPYGREIGEWVRKAYKEALAGAVMVCLLPARTDTRWWHRHVMRAKEVRLIKGRLRFVGANNSAPFPSAIVVFTEDMYLRPAWFSSCDRTGKIL